MNQIKKIPVKKDIPPIRGNEKKLELIQLEDLPLDHKEEKINIFRKFWAWINGKKTIIGTSGSLIGLGLTKIANPIFQIIGYVLQGICYPLTATGIIHKIDKAIKSNKFGEPGQLKIGEMDLVTLVVKLWNNIKESFLIIKEVLGRIKKK